MPATDLGYLLAKNPAKAQTFKLPFGKAHVFYPEADNDKCTMALLLDIDPVGLVRGKNGSGGSLSQYVNDRPYVASSYLSVALSEVFRSALNGQSKERPELTGQALPLTTTLYVAPSRGGQEWLFRLFEPLGYKVEADAHPLDAKFNEWGQSPYYTVRLTGMVRLQDLLTHLYVLVPTLDEEKHYAIGDDEVEKLIRRGEGWLSLHPEKDAIVRRYLKRHHSLIRDALAQLVRDEPQEQGTDETERVAEATGETTPQENEKRAKRLGLHEERLNAVLQALVQSGAKTVLDAGCGEGKLVQKLLRERQFTRILGMDISYRTLERAQEKIVERLPSFERERVSLIHGSLMYRDERLSGFDAAALVEVIEHLDAPRLRAFERVLFEFARPQTVVVTTPNAEYNVRFETLPEGKMRHVDHRFEWTRAEFARWCDTVCKRFGYTAIVTPLGSEDTEVGAPSQMAVFEIAEVIKAGNVKEAEEAGESTDGN